IPGNLAVDKPVRKSLITGRALARRRQGPAPGEGAGVAPQGKGGRAANGLDKMFRKLIGPCRRR
ncbi:MAG: hypothetical protein COS90_06535, partial [Deltaproteobacteria bacterium CG07_land_8_20_14_0_80_60_11]